MEDDVLGALPELQHSIWNSIEFLKRFDLAKRKLVL